MIETIRILLVDDDAVDRASVRRALSRAGMDHEITEAPDGTTGLALAKTEHFDCVLLDYRLPDVDTFELLAKLVLPEGGSHTVLMLTGEGDQELALKLMRAGALDYLTKSEVTPSSLARAIRYAKARREFMRQLETERRNAEAQSAALGRLNSQKTILFSIISHDLRSPFQGLLGLSEMLSRALQAEDYAAAGRRAAGLNHSAKQAYALMEGLFGWATLQMETAQVTLKPLELAEVVHEAAAAAALNAAEKGLALEVSSPPVKVLAHRDMLAAVIRNLVSNAVKFTPAGGTVAVSASVAPDGTSAEVEVRDSGVGIPPERLPNLLKMEHRITTHGTDGERGSGFGLLLCRDLLEQLGSALTVESEVGVGTAFRFSLPVLVEQQTPLYSLPSSSGSRGASPGTA